MIRTVAVIIFLTYPYAAFGSFIAKIVKEFPACNNSFCSDVDFSSSIHHRIKVDKEVNTLITGIPLLKYYSDALSQQGVPSYYALIPMLESSNLPTAVSSAGASGVWQLMPSTAYDGGIFMQNNYDFRQDLYLSTTTAVRHIKVLHDKYFGNLVIVLAAYNWGGANVDRLLKKFNHNEDFYLNLPEETKNYISKFYSIKKYILSTSFSHPIWSYPDVHYLKTVSKSEIINMNFYYDNKIVNFLNPNSIYRDYFVIPTENFNEFYYTYLSIKPIAKKVKSVEQKTCFFSDLYQISYIIKNTDTVYSLSKLLDKEESFINKNYAIDGILNVGMVIRMPSKKLISPCI
jgi:membrane-bound lytic murein transglycosylase D